MIDQPINDTDYIKNAIQSKWTKGAYPPEWPEDLGNLTINSLDVYINGEPVELEMI